MGESSEGETGFGAEQGLTGPGETEQGLIEPGETEQGLTEPGEGELGLGAGTEMGRDRASATKFSLPGTWIMELVNSARYASWRC